MRERCSFLNLFASERAKTTSAWAALFLILTATISHTFFLLLKHSIAVGVDGYYYVLQVETLRRQGSFYFPTLTPFVLYLLTALSYLIGNTICAIKIGSVMLHAALCLVIFAIVVSLTRSVWLGILGGALAAISGLRFYMIAEFIDLSGAMVFLLLCLLCVCLWLQTRRMKWMIYGIACFAGASFSHRTAIFIALSVAGCGQIVKCLVGARSKPAHRLMASLLVVVCWLLPFILAAQSLVRLPTWVIR